MRMPWQDPPPLLQVTLESSVQLFSAAHSQGRPLRSLEAGDVVDIIALAPGWYRARAQERRHWFCRRTRGWLAQADLAFVPLAAARAAGSRPEPLVRTEHLDAIRRVLDALPPDGGADAAPARELLRTLASQAAFLNDVADDAYAYLRGSPDAELRLLATLNGWADLAGTPPSVPTGAGAWFAGPDLPGGPPAGLPSLPCVVGARGFALLNTAIVQLARGSADPGQAREVEWNYLWAAEAQVRGLAGLDRLLGAATRTLRQRIPDYAGFGRVVESVLRDRAAPSPPHQGYTPPPRDPVTGVLPLPLPGGGAHLPPDLCRAQRWGETARLVRCACLEAYRIDAIRSLDRSLPDGTPLPREGCAGDWVEIEGLGFGDRREWPMDLGASEVVFSSPDPLGVPATEYGDDWSDTRVRARIPLGAGSGPITLRILCRRTVSGHPINPTRCGMPLRRPVDGPLQRFFTLTPPPRIARFAVPLGTADWMEGTVARLRCQEVDLNIRAEDAQEAWVSDDAGRRLDLPGAGPGERRTIEGVVTVNESVHRTYTLHARNACHPTASAVLTVERRGWLNPSADRYLVSPGESVSVHVQLMCPPDRIGVDEVWVDFAGPAGVAFAEPALRFAGTDVRRSTVATVGWDRCTELRITATGRGLADHPVVGRDSAGGFSLFVVGNPRISDVRTPEGRDACGRFPISCRVNCDVAARLATSLEFFPEGRPGGAVTGLLLSAHAAGDGNVTVYGMAPELAPGRWHFRLRIGDMPTNDEPLGALESPPVSIDYFHVEPRSIGPGGHHGPAIVRWRVRHARAVELWRDVREFPWPVLRHAGTWPSHRSACERGPWEMEYEVRDPFVYQEFRLLATGYDGDEATAELQIASATTTPTSTPGPVEVVGVRSCTIYNCNRHTAIVYRRELSPFLVDGLPRLLPVSPYREVARLDRHVTATCPDFSTDSEEITFEEGRYSELRAILVIPDSDPDSEDWPFCETEDPEANFCQVGIFTLLGDAEGLRYVWNLVDNPVRLP